MELGIGGGKRERRGWFEQMFCGARTVLMNFFMVIPPILCTDPSHCRFKAAVFFNSNAKPRVMQEVWGIFAKKNIYAGERRQTAA